MKTKELKRVKKGLKYFAHKIESRPIDYQEGDCFTSKEALLSCYPETSEDEIEMIEDSPLLNPLGD